MEEGELFRLTWNAGNAKEESLTFEWDMTLSRLFENPNQESDRTYNIAERCMSVNTIKRLKCSMAPVYLGMATFRVILL